MRFTKKQMIACARRSRSPATGTPSTTACCSSASARYVSPVAPSSSTTGIYETTYDTALTLVKGWMG